MLLVVGAAGAHSSGRIEGELRDGTGSGLPSVSIEASGGALQGVRVAQTDKEGRFALPALPPGSYRLRVALPGFRTEERPIVVALGATASVSVVLSPEVEAAVATIGAAMQE